MNRQYAKILPFDRIGWFHRVVLSSLLLFFSWPGALVVRAQGFFCPAPNSIFSTGTILQLTGGGPSSCTLVGTGQFNSGAGVVSHTLTLSPQAMQAALNFIAGCSSGATRVTHCSPGGRVVGDFNGDGKLDMAERDMNSGVVSIFMGTAAGSVTLSNTYSAGQNPFTVLTGDFNGDGKIDLAVVNFGPLDGGNGTVSILLGNGDGTFQPAVNYNVGFNPTSGVVADFNGDGKLDLVVVNSGAGDGGSLSILLGKGDGTFQTPVDFHVNAFLQSIAVGDLNGDGKLDLAVGTMNFDGTGGLAIFPGNGDGTFHYPVIYQAGDSPLHIAEADVNGDGNLDLVVVNEYSNNVEIFLGNGDGTIQPPLAYAVGQGPTFVGIQDLNGDGKPDLVVLNRGNLNFSILFGNGDGTFVGPRFYQTDTDANFVTSGDLNNDSNSDLITANQHDNSVSTLLGNGDGTLGTPAKTSVVPPNLSPTTPFSVAVGDFNGDGKFDLAVAELDGGAVSILMGVGDGTLQSPTSFNTGKNSMSVAVGDFNADGKTDLAVANYGDLPGHGTTTGSISILIGNGDGTFQPAVNHTAGSHPQFVAVGDFNGDGKLDLAVVNFGVSGGDPGDVEVLLGNGDGTFQTPAKYVVGTNPNALALGDFNGDGKLDLAVSTMGSSVSSNVAILFGNSNGTFQPPVMYPTDLGSQSLAVSDINGDGKADIVVAHCCGNTSTTYLLNNGDGTFAPEVHLTAGAAPFSLALTDLNGDGKPDLAVGGSGDYMSGVSILLNQNSSTCPNIVLTPGSTPNGAINVAYNQTLIASGGTSSYSFALTGGVLPPGVSLSALGTLSGTPTTGGVFQFTATATDANGCRRSQSYSLTVTGGAIAGNPTRNLSLSNGGAVAASTIGSSGPVQVGDATVTINSGSTPYGTAVFSYALNGVVVSETGVPASPPTTSVRLFIDYRTGVAAKSDHGEISTINIDTGVAIVNHSHSTANVTYTMHGSTGTTLASGAGTVPPLGHQAKFIDQLSDIASGFVLPANFSTTTQFATLDMTSDQPLSVLAMRLTTNQRGETLITSTPIADLTQTPGSGSLDFPQLADGNGFTTFFILLNTSGTTESGTLHIYKNDGTPLIVQQVSGPASSSFPYVIPAGGFYIFQTDGSPLSVNTGSVQVVPDPSTSTPVGAGVFRLNQGGIVVAESGIPSASPTTHARIYIDESGGHDTGIAVASPSGSPVSVTANAFQLDGVTPVGASLGPVVLSGNGHDAKYAGQLISGLPAGFTGVLDLSSASPFVALTVRLLTNARGETLFATFPIADLNTAAPSPIVFPQIADGGGFRTQFIFISPSGAATVTLNFFGDDGSPLAVGKRSN